MTMTRKSSAGKAPRDGGWVSLQQRYYAGVSRYAMVAVIQNHWSPNNDWSSVRASYSRTPSQSPHHQILRMRYQGVPRDIEDVIRNDRKIVSILLTLSP